MHKLTGTCSCGRSTLRIELPQPAAAYAPRRCDCDFCTSRHLCYVSDPQGQLRLHSDQAFLTLRQGSQQAEFLACSHCQTVLAVCYREANICVGAANASLLQPINQFSEAVTVQPRLLAADTKTERWKQLWTPLVVEEG